LLRVHLAKVTQRVNVITRGQSEFNLAASRLTEAAIIFRSVNSQKKHKSDDEHPMLHCAYQTARNLLILGIPPQACNGAWG